MIKSAQSPRFRWLLTISFFVSICTVQAQLSEAENAALDDLIANNIVISADAHSSKVLSSICNADFFIVKHVPRYRADGMYNEILLMKTADGYIEIQESADLLTAIRDDFKLSNETDAQAFEKLLDSMFPVFSQSAKQIIQKETQWIFVRSDSWGEKVGTIVTVNATGKIEKIESNQEITES